MVAVDREDRAKIFEEGNIFQFPSFTSYNITLPLHCLELIVSHSLCHARSGEDLVFIRLYLTVFFVYFHTMFTRAGFVALRSSCTRPVVLVESIHVEEVTNEVRVYIISGQPLIVFLTVTFPPHRESVYRWSSCHLHWQYLFDFICTRSSSWITWAVSSRVTLTPASIKKHSVTPKVWARECVYRLRLVCCCRLNSSYLDPWHTWLVFWRPISSCPCLLLDPPGSVKYTIPVKCRSQYSEWLLHIINQTILISVCLSQS